MSANLLFKVNERRYINIYLNIAQKNDMHHLFSYYFIISISQEHQVQSRGGGGGN